MKIRKKNKELPSESGFSLLEVLLALTIFSVTAIMLYGQINQSLNSVSRIEQKQLALIVAKNRLSELALEREFMEAGHNQEVIDMSEISWHLSIIVAKTVNDDFIKVTVKVYESSDDLRDDFSIVSLDRFLGRY